MFQEQNGEGYRTPLPGVKMNALCYGEKTLMTEFVVEAGSDLPVHRHPYEHRRGIW